MTCCLLACRYVLSMCLWLSADGSMGAVPQSIRENLLAGNWEATRQAMIRDDVSASDPVNRLIAAHACLATNHNNESSRLFLLTRSESAAKRWETWTTEVLREKPGNAIALYLAADAKVRRGDLVNASALFDKAIEVQPDMGLAYNARGVMKIYKGEMESAFSDFVLAAQLCPNLADAHTNLGNYAVLREASADMSGNSDLPPAIRHYDQALTLNPTFAQAYNGRGCLLFGAGRFEHAADDFIQAHVLVPELAITKLNESFALVRAAEIATLADVTRPNRRSGTGRLETYQVALRERQQKIQERLREYSLPEKWDGPLQDMEPRFRTRLLERDYDAIETAIAGRMTDLEMRIAVARYEMDQAMKGLDFAARLNRKLKLVDTVNSIFVEGALSGGIALARDTVAEHGDQTLATTAITESVPSQESRAVVNASIATILRGLGGGNHVCYGVAGPLDWR